MLVFLLASFVARSAAAPQDQPAHELGQVVKMRR
jgi:hypothetical protein